jgi:hypothetical protein
MCRSKLIYPHRDETVVEYRFERERERETQEKERENDD